MQNLIKDGRVVTDDGWQLVDSLDAELPAGDVIVPLARWKALRAEGAPRAGRLAPWLAPDDDPLALQGELADLPLIAVYFPVFTDGRGYSSARLLRERLVYRGELRAIGDVWQDQLFYLHQVGFDAFVVSKGLPLVESLRGLADFSDSYQSTYRQPLPLFRRRSER